MSFSLAKGMVFLVLVVVLFAPNVVSLKGVVCKNPQFRDCDDFVPKLLVVGVGAWLIFSFWDSWISSALGLSRSWWVQVERSDTIIQQASAELMARPSIGLNLNLYSAHVHYLEGRKGCIIEFSQEGIESKFCLARVEKLKPGQLRVFSGLHDFSWFQRHYAKKSLDSIVDAVFLREVEKSKAALLPPKPVEVPMEAVIK